MLRLKDALNSFCIDAVDLIKIDVEGFEYEAIMGSKEIFVPDRIRRIALELHPDLLKRRGHSPSALVDFLEKQGYCLDSSVRHRLFVPNERGTHV